VDAHSFTAGADYRVFAVTTTGFSGGSADTLRNTISSGETMLEAENEDGANGSASNIAGAMWVAAPAENDTFAIGINAGATIVAIVDAARERVAPEWNVIAGTGVFTGSFIIKLSRKRPTEELRID